MSVLFRCANNMHIYIYIFFPLNGLRSQQYKKKHTTHRVNLFLMRMMHNTLLYEISHSFGKLRAQYTHSKWFLHRFVITIKLCIFFPFFQFVIIFGIKHQPSRSRYFLPFTTSVCHIFMSLGWLNRLNRRFKIYMYIFHYNTESSRNSTNYF